MLYLDIPFQVPSDHPTAPRCFRGKRSAHLMADTEEELVHYARLLGMRAFWLQRPGTPYAHFDLTGAKLAIALGDPGVRKITKREMLRLVHSRQRSQESA